MRTTAALLLLAAAALAQSIEDVKKRYVAQEREAVGHYRRKDYAKAVEAFERQAAIFADNPGPYYNIACCYALQGDAARAGTWLTLAIDRGWRDAAHLAQDPDFDRVRQSADYIGCLARLKRARQIDPDPMPSIVPAPEAPSLRDLSEEEKAIRTMEVLYGSHQYRKRLFDVLDRRMAVLLQYVVQNGDTPHAAHAAAARVQTAVSYLVEGRSDARLREIAAEYVLRTAEEFLRGYPGGAGLPDVQLARAGALRLLRRDTEAIAMLRTLRADHPTHGLHADAELCELLPAGDELKEARARLGALAPMRARLLCDGVPELLALDEAVASRVAAHEGLVAYVFVTFDDPESEGRLKELPEPGARLLPVVVCVGGEPDAKWLADHARGFPVIARGAEAVMRSPGGMPSVVVARRDGAVVAIDPDAAELARLARP